MLCVARGRSERQKELSYRKHPHSLYWESSLMHSTAKLWTPQPDPKLRSQNSVLLFFRWNASCSKWSEHVNLKKSWQSYLATPSIELLELNRQQISSFCNISELLQPCFERGNKYWYINHIRQWFNYLVMLFAVHICKMFTFFQQVSYRTVGSCMIYKPNKAFVWSNFNWSWLSENANYFRI